MHSHHALAINYTSTDLQSWAESYGAAIRIGMSKLVELKSQEKRQRCLAQVPVP